MSEWIPVGLIAVQVLFSSVVAVVGWLLKRQIDQNDRKIEALFRRVQEIEGKRGAGEKSSIIHDGLIRERLAGGYVSKDECARCKNERRETTTLLFQKIERVQEGQAGVAGKLDALIRLAGDGKGR